MAVRVQQSTTVASLLRAVSNSALLFPDCTHTHYTRNLLHVYEVCLHTPHRGYLNRPVSTGCPLNFSLLTRLAAVTDTAMNLLDRTPACRLSAPTTYDAGSQVACDKKMTRLVVTLQASKSIC